MNPSGIIVFASVLCLTYGYYIELRNDRDVCAGAPTCPPPPSHDCTTSYQHKYVNGVRCDWGCKHWCCSDVHTLQATCPETSPSNPYCVSTQIVRYTINGRECPVYCGCIPDCSVLTC